MVWHIFTCWFFFPLAVLKLILLSGDRIVQSPPLSIKDQKEKAKRSEFAQGLLLSTILDDNL